jgi:formamidase
VAGQGWGYAGIFARENGGGFLTDLFPAGYKAVWDFHGREATSPHLPGVRFSGMPHTGIIGTAPSRPLLEQWNRREQALIDTAPDAVPPLALPPDPHNALLGGLKGDEAAAAAREAARTVPPRENAGNQDIKNSPSGHVSSCRSSPTAACCPSATCTSPRGTGRSPSAAPSRWAATWISTST